MAVEVDVAGFESIDRTAFIRLYAEMLLLLRDRAFTAGDPLPFEVEAREAGVAAVFGIEHHPYRAGIAVDVSFRIGNGERAEGEMAVPVFYPRLDAVVGVFTRIRCHLYGEAGEYPSHVGSRHVGIPDAEVVGVFGSHIDQFLHQLWERELLLGIAFSRREIIGAGL